MRLAKRRFNAFRQWMGRPSNKVALPLLGIVTTLALGMLLSLGLAIEPYDYGVGEVVPMTILSPKTLYYVDNQATEQLRAEVAASEPKAYNNRPEAKQEAIEAVQQVQQQLVNAATDEKLKGLSTDQKLQHIARSVPGELAPRQVATLLALPPDELKDAFSIALKLVTDQMDNPITSDGNGLKLAREAFLQQLKEQGLDPEVAQALGVALVEALRPNSILDSRETEQRQRSAAASIEPVERRINAGDLIVRSGQEVTPAIQDRLAAVNEALRTPDYSRMFAYFLLVGAIVALLAGILYRYNDFIFASLRPPLLLASLLVIVTAFIKAQVFSGLVPARGAISPEHLNLLAGLLLVEGAVMMTAILIKGRVAVHLAWALSILAAIAYDSNFVIGVSCLLTSIFGVIVATNMSRRIELLAKSWLFMGIANVMVILIFEQLAKGMITPGLWKVAFIGGGAVGLMASMITVGGTLLLESALDALTPFRLTELAGADHPLLHELAMKAPGSYQSCIRVSTLAQAAAEAIGVNSQLAKVGALYHDIGKLSRPYCFIENQGGGENPHERLSPELSKRIIMNHVKYGLELGRKQRLPRQVLDIIAESHGTTLIRFFYVKAVQEFGSDQVKESDYRYPGPKPHLKESGLVMLADNIESRVTAAGGPGPAQVEEIIHKATDELIADGQFDECDLTLGDIAAAHTAFKRVLQGILHHRIEYPELASVGLTNGDNNK